MAKISSSADKFNNLEDALIKDLGRFKDQHDASEEAVLRVARGKTLNRISDIVGKVAAMGDPQLILDVERHCERFYLASFAHTDHEKQSCMKALQTMQDVKRTLAAPLNPEQYKNDMRENLGAVNMEARTLVPHDTVHLFVKSQRQRLAKAAGQMATPPEEWYFHTRSKAMYTLLKLHEKNCQSALGIVREDKVSKK